MINKKLLLGLTVLFLIFLMNPPTSSGLDIGGFISSLFKKDKKVSYEGNNVVMTKGDNRFVATKSEQFNADLRVYGFNENKDSKMGPWSIITHFFIASPLQNNEMVFKRLGCEKTALQNATMIQIIAEESDLKNKIAELKNSKDRRNCVSITGTSLTIKEYTYKGENRTDGWRTTGKFKSDPYVMVLLKGIAEVKCE